MTWLWILIIVIGAAIACAALYVFEKRKQIFKKRTKEEKAAIKAKKAAKKQAKLNKKQNLPPKEPEKPKEEISFTEKKVQEPKPAATFESEPFVPDIPPMVSPSMFESRPAPAGMGNRMSDAQRRQMMERRAREMDKFNRSGRTMPRFTTRENIKDQIDNLSPEMKVILLTGALERKEDDEF